MYPIGAPQVRQGHRQVRPIDRGAAARLRHENATTPFVSILSVGCIEPGTVIRDALLSARVFRASSVDSRRDLWTSSKQHEVHAVIFHNSLCSFQLLIPTRGSRAPGWWSLAECQGCGHSFGPVISPSRSLRPAPPCTCARRSIAPTGLQPDSGNTRGGTQWQPLGR